MRKASAAGPARDGAGDTFVKCYAYLSLTEDAFVLCVLHCYVPWSATIDAISSTFNLLFMLGVPNRSHSI